MRKVRSYIIFPILLAVWLCNSHFQKENRSNRMLTFSFDPRTIVSKIFKNSEISQTELDPWFHLKNDPGMRTESCEIERGQSGIWVQDMQYGALAQYKIPLKRFRNFPSFVPSPEQPFRKSTTFKWVDNSCPVHLITLEGLCHAMKALDLSRIHIVGDSLNLQFMQALWKLLGHMDDPMTKTSKHDPQWLRYQYSRTVECPSNFQFEIAFTRNDLIDGQETNIEFDKIDDHQFNCGNTEFCFPWNPMYTTYPGKTLLIANAGSHIHSQSDFVQVFDNFLRLIEKRKNPGDIVMFRSTVPGHHGCEDPNVRPLKSISEFEMAPDDFSWNKFDGYNQYARKAIDTYNQNHLDLPIHLLDVAPMTILRKDGHISGPEKCGACGEGDCLHYILPGPLDWWVHLMYSNLVNLVLKQ
mmetsp:Transcript_9909/g.15259  ORF Transcript_9909/g.15259 Transcript_9909/m.15259 type:complete len:411 (+) Transcript_9909:68-1300(+)